MNPPLTSGSALRAVRAALASGAATSALAEVPFEPLHGGLSNHSWRAAHDGRSYFIRFGGPDAASLGVDRHGERMLLVTAGAAGLAPPLVACDPANGLLVTHYLAGGPWRRDDAHDPRNLERIAERLRVLHGLPVPAGVPEVDFSAQAQRLSSQLGALGVTDLLLATIAQSAFAVLASRPPATALCHNDLHHLNILDHEGRLWLVDWEYGGCGNPLFDLASFACQHEFTREGRGSLLDAYGVSDVASRALLDAACIAFDYVQWLWYRLWAARNPGAGHEYRSRAQDLRGRLAAE
jgi:thiamine kinase